MLRIGQKGEARVAVTTENSAKTMGSGELDVFATPAMVALIEKAAWQSVSDELEPGWGSVGTLLSVKHLSATPIGTEVTARTELVEIDRRRLVFSVQVEDEYGLVGEGMHERFLVENASFLAKAEAKTALNNKVNTT